jgi:hypothetical protein
MFTRPRSTAILVLVVATFPAFLSGCRQGTGPLSSQMGTGGGSPLMPAQSPQMSPLSANPFSPGSTRVTPPPTGSVGSGASLGTPGVLQPASNSYLGSQIQFPSSNDVAMGMGNAGLANNGTQNGLFLNQNVIGSGVQPASFTETASNVNPNTSSFSNQMRPLDSLNSIPPSNSSNPYRDSDRSGMRVIDLMNAPAPPNYQPQYNPPGQFPPAQFQPSQVMPPQVQSAQFQQSQYQPRSIQESGPTPGSQNTAIARLPSRQPTTSVPPSNEPLQWRRPGMAQ